MLWQRDRAAAPERARGASPAMAESTPSARSAALAGLLARTALADQAAFAELYRQTSAHLYAVALRILREPATAEEMLQEAFVSVWHHAGSYAPRRASPRPGSRASSAIAASTACAGASPTP